MSHCGVTLLTVELRRSLWSSAGHCGITPFTAEFRQSLWSYAGHCGVTPVTVEFCRSLWSYAGHCTVELRWSLWSYAGHCVLPWLNSYIYSTVYRTWVWSWTHIIGIGYIYQAFALKIKVFFEYAPPIMASLTISILFLYFIHSKVLGF